jgi:predicted esterase
MMGSVRRVLFVHGLEGSPQGSKARYLAERFEAETPAMDTSFFPGCARLQAERIAAFQPDVLVGSSFGGAVAVALLQQGVWRGPTVLLAPAVRHFAIEPVLPGGVAVTIVHGKADDVVDIETSRVLAGSGAPGRVRLLEVDDGHRLESLLADDTLERLVVETAARQPREPAGGAA